MSKRTVQVVCAISSPDGIFGEGDGLPWKFGRPNEDFKRFKDLTGETTKGSVIMGRATWESLPLNFRPLKGRQNIVVTRNLDYYEEGAEVCYSLDEALERAESPTISIIGGRELVKEALERHLIDVAHITVVEKTLPSTDATVYFPQLLSSEFLFHLASISVEQHTQALEDGAFVNILFKRYERRDT